MADTGSETLERSYSALKDAFTNAERNEVLNNVPQLVIFAEHALKVSKKCLIK